jgi:hypothetical protein
VVFTDFRLWTGKDRLAENGQPWKMFLIAANGGTAKPLLPASPTESDLTCSPRRQVGICHWHSRFNEEAENVRTKTCTVHE